MTMKNATASLENDFSFLKNREARQHRVNLTAFSLRHTRFGTRFVFKWE